MITPITSHSIDAAKRLLYQYADKKKLKDLLDALFGLQVQRIEDASWPLLTRLDIDGSEGEQLDRIGSIVGQARMGLDDPVYRIWLKAKIGKNVSESDMERVISIWKLINTNATVIRVTEHFPAEIAIYSNAPVDLTWDLTTEGGADLVQENDITMSAIVTNYVRYIFNFAQEVVGAGIRVGYIAVFDSDDAFGFENSTNSGGFGDLNDVDAGGELSYIELPLLPSSL
ncbi:MAG: DUF2612 domain-containing protein [bacterium]